MGWRRRRRRRRRERPLFPVLWWRSGRRREMVSEVSVSSIKARVGALPWWGRGGEDEGELVNLV